MRFGLLTTGGPFRVSTMILLHHATSERSLDWTSNIDTAIEANLLRRQTRAQLSHVRGYSNEGTFFQVQYNYHD